MHYGCQLRERLHLPHLFRSSPVRQRGLLHQITQQNLELPPLGLRAAQRKAPTGKRDIAAGEVVWLVERRYGLVIGASSRAEAAIMHGAP